MPDNENWIYSDPETVLWLNAQPSKIKTHNDTTGGGEHYEMNQWA